MQDEELNFVGCVAQKAIIEHEGRVLLMRNRGRQTWELLGGRLQTGEEPRAGLARELQEEIGVNVRIGAPIDVGTFILTRTNQPHFFVVYAATLIDPTAELVTPADEVEEVAWFGKDEIETLEIWDNYKQALKKFFVQS